MNSIHPTLKSLWNIPQIIRFPDPMPPVPDVRKLIQQRIFDCRVEKGALDPQLRDYAERVHDCNVIICILEHKLEELHRAFPETFQPSQQTPNNFISPQNIPQSETTLADQHSTGGNEAGESGNLVGKGGNEVGIGETGPTSSGNFSPDPTPKATSESRSETDPISDADSEDDDTEESDDKEDDAEDSEDEDIDLADYLDDETLDVALDLKEHLSGRSLLDNLQPRIQQVILRLLDDHDGDLVAEVIAEPPPIGFAVKTSKSSLYRFRDRYNEAKDKAIKSQNAKAIEDLLAKAGASDEAFQAAVQCVLKARLLTTTSQPNADLSTIDALITSLTKLRKQSLAERKQLHVEKKAQQ